MTALKLVLGANVNFGLDTVCIDPSMVFDAVKVVLGANVN